MPAVCLAAYYCPFRCLVILYFRFEASGLPIDPVTDRARSMRSVSRRLARPPGFDFSVLSEFRQHLLASGPAQMLPDTLLDCLKAQGVLKARGR
jgi:hypothetical protein